MNISDIPARLSLLRKEWDDLVPTIKFTIIFSALLLFLLWFDKTMQINFYKSAINLRSENNISFFYFTLVNLFLLLIFIILILSRSFIDIKKIYFKIKYPLRNLNKCFIIVSFRGTVCLLDLHKKEFRWIKTWETALDLDFIGEWTNVDIDITQPNSMNNTFTTRDGVTINLKDYKYVNGIHTQKPAGT